MQGVEFESWVEGSDSIKNLIYSAYPFENSAEILVTDVEGKVFKLGDFVIKERQKDWFGAKVCNVCIRREYEVGKILNQLNSSHLVRTYGYFEINNKSYIVLGYVPGETLTNFSSNQKVSSGILYHVLLILMYLQEVAKFTHYDLHFGNIILTPLNQVKTFQYTINGQVYSVNNNFNITIIDFGRSHVVGIPSMYYEAGMVAAYTTPGIFDSQIDLAFLFRSGLRSPRLKQLLIENGLIDDNNELKFYEHNFTMGDLFQNGKVWAANEGNGINHFEFTDIYTNYMLGLLIRNNIGLTDLEQIDLEENNQDEYYYHIANSVPFEVKISPEITEYFIKQLGMSLVTTKLNLMEKRVHSTSELFRTALEWCLSKMV